VAQAGSPLIIRHGDEVAQAYLNASRAGGGRPAAGPALNVVYTPLHGVAGELMLRAIRQAGFALRTWYGASRTDPDFPTSRFPTRRSRVPSTWP